MKVFLFVILALLFANCSKQSEIAKANTLPANFSKQEIVLPASEVDNQSTAKPVIDEKRYDNSGKGIKGLIVLNDKGENPKDFIRFYNEDGSIWYEFTSRKTRQA